MKRNIMGHITPTEIILLTENDGKLTVETVNNYKAIACDSMAEAMSYYKEMVYKITTKEREVI
jgi:hypothetical protein